MLLNNETRHFSSNVTDSPTHQFAVGNMSKMIKIIRDTGYTNKIHSSVREIYSNALDANVMSNSNKKVLVGLTSKGFLTTDGQHQLFIRDYGPGLSYDSICNIFAMYGVSTKEGQANQIGGFGIGAKSPFSYTDTFIVHSFFEGEQTTYCCYLDADGNSLLDILNKEKTTQDSGLCIQIPVQVKDHVAFQHAISCYCLINSHNTDLCFFENYEQFENYTPVKQNPLFDFLVSESPNVCEQRVRVVFYKSQEWLELRNANNYFLINNIAYDAGNIHFINKKILTTPRYLQNHRGLVIIPYVNLLYGSHLSINAFRENASVEIAEDIDLRFYDLQELAIRLLKNNTLSEVVDSFPKEFSTQVLEQVKILRERRLDYLRATSFYNKNHYQNFKENRFLFNFDFSLLDTLSSKKIYPTNISFQEFIQLVISDPQKQSFPIDNIKLVPNTKILNLTITASLNKSQIEFCLVDSLEEENPIFIYEESCPELDEVKQTLLEHKLDKFTCPPSVFKKMWSFIKKGLTFEAKTKTYKAQFLMRQDIESFKIDDDEFIYSFPAIKDKRQENKNLFLSVGPDYIAFDIFKKYHLVVAKAIQKHAKDQNVPVQTSKQKPVSPLLAEALKVEKEVLYKNYTRICGRLLSGRSHEGVDLKDDRFFYVFVDLPKNFLLQEFLSLFNLEFLEVSDRETVLINIQDIPVNYKLYSYLVYLTDGVLEEPENLGILNETDIKIIRDSLPLSAGLFSDETPSDALSFFFNFCKKIGITPHLSSFYYLANTALKLLDNYRAREEFGYDLKTHHHRINSFYSMDLSSFPYISHFMKVYSVLTSLASSFQPFVHNTITPTVNPEFKKYIDFYDIFKDKYIYCLNYLPKPQGQTFSGHFFLKAKINQVNFEFLQIVEEDIKKRVFEFGWKISF